MDGETQSGETERGGAGTLIRVSRVWTNVVMVRLQRKDDYERC